jgi:hypothetical protein
MVLLYYATTHGIASLPVLHLFAYIYRDLNNIHIYFQLEYCLNYFLSQIAFQYLLPISTSNIYFQTLSMDPFGFDMKAYFEKRDAEDTYMVNRFIQRRKKLEEGSGSGSGSRKKKYLNRDHAAANQRLIDDYFANEPTYDDAMFRRRFRMQKHVFL